MNSKDRKKLKNQKDRRNTAKMLTLISQFGINMLVPIFLCFFLGYFLDKKLGTNFIMIIMFFVGAIAGFTNVYRLAVADSKKETSDDKKKPDDKQER